MIDTAVLDQIQSVLLEPRDLGATYPSGLWTAQEILDRMNERLNRFLKATKLMVSVAQVPLLPQGGSPITKAQIGQHVYTLPQDWLLTVSLIWRGDDGVVKEVPRGDSFEADHGLPYWPTTYGTPQLYFDYDSPVLQIKVAPAPDQTGTFQLLYVASAETLDGTGILINLPDEFVADACKYGTLADAFGKDGRGRSPDRAQYCEQRYALGQEVAAILLRSWQQE